MDPTGSSKTPQPDRAPALVGPALDDEPRRAERRDVSLGEVIASTIGLALLAGVLIWQPGYRASWTPEATSIPVLDPGLAAFWIPFLVVVIAANIALLVAVYRHGHWTVGLASVNTVLNLAFAVPVIWLVGTDQVLNPAFVDMVTIPGVVTPPFLPSLVVWLIAGIAVLDTATSWWKAGRHPRSPRTHDEFAVKSR